MADGRLLVLAASGFLAACAPAATEAASERLSPREYFEQTFSGRWGVDASCPEEGMFRFSPDHLALYERSCDVIGLTRNSDRMSVRTRCQEEGQPMADNTHTLFLVSDDTIRVEDGHYEWIRHACGAVEAQTQGAQ